MPHSIPRLLQQQPRPSFSREQQQQQQSGSTEFQPPRGDRGEHEQAAKQNPSPSQAPAE